VFSGAIANGGVVKAQSKGMAGATQGQIETMTNTRRVSREGLAFIKVERSSGTGVSPVSSK